MTVVQIDVVLFFLSLLFIIVKVRVRQQRRALRRVQPGACHQCHRTIVVLFDISVYIYCGYGLHHEILRSVYSAGLVHPSILSTKSVLRNDSIDVVRCRASRVVCTRHDYHQYRWHDAFTSTFGARHLWISSRQRNHR